MNGLTIQPDNQAADPLFDVLKDLHKRLADSGVKEVMVMATFYPSRYGGGPCGFSIQPTTGDLLSGNGGTPESALADFRRRQGERTNSKLEEARKLAESLGFELVPKVETQITEGTLQNAN